MNRDLGASVPPQLAFPCFRTVSFGVTWSGPKSSPRTYLAPFQKRAALRVTEARAPVTTSVTVLEPFRLKRTELGLELRCCNSGRWGATDGRPHRLRVVPAVLRSCSANLKLVCRYESAPPSRGSKRSVVSFEASGRAAVDQLRWCTICSTMSFASPNSIWLFSRKNSGFCTPA